MIAKQDGPRVGIPAEHTHACAEADCHLSADEPRPIALWHSRHDSWRRSLIWLPIPLLLLAIVMLWAGGSHKEYDAPFLMIALNFVTRTLASVLIVFMATRSFTVRGELSLLLLGCGVAIWGSSGFIASVAVSAEENSACTISSVGAWLSALCHLVGTGLPFVPKKWGIGARRTPGMWVATGYTLAFGAVGLLTLATFAGWLPIFVVQGQGTLVRQLVLSSAVAMFVLAALALLLEQRAESPRFAYWYGMALLLIAVGQFGVMLASFRNSALDWTCRGALYFSGIYMAAAALAAVHENHAWRVSLERLLRQRYESLFELAADGIVLHEVLGPTVHGHFIESNPAICAMLGYTRDEMRRLTLLDLLAPEDLKGLGADTALLAQKGTRHQKTALAKDGRRLTVEITSRQFQQHGRMLAISVFHDITQRKLAEEALKAAKAEAERANRVKDEFLAVLSHELRTPLTSMLGWARLLQTREIDKATLQRGLEVIVRNVKTQAHIVEDLLDVSRIVAGKMSVEKVPLDFAAVIAETVIEFSPAVDAKHLTLHCQRPESLLINGDPSRIRQLVWNLLSNATKFTPRGGRIDIKLEIQQRRAVLSISDTGKGISHAFLPHLFEHFRQEDGGPSRRHMGLGLGLAISHSIVELHGGSLAASSPGEGQGTTFTVSLPTLAHTQVTPAPGSLQAVKMERSLQHERVLVIDDDEDVRDFLQTGLNACGAEVRTAAASLEAQKAFREFQPTVLISDIGMPGEDGYVLIAKIREIERHQGRPAIPAVALTGYAGPEEAERCRAAGYQAHVAKPVEPETLVSTITKLRAL